jgi:glycosyltransferase involved in cell wall biosynthesis
VALKGRDGMSAKDVAHLRLADDMRLLVVGHTYAMSYAQHKFAAMKRIDASIKLRLLVPSQWTHLNQSYARERIPSLDRDEIVYASALLKTSHMTYVLDPIILCKTLATFRPTHIHIEEDPHSLVGLETVAAARIFSPDASVSFFLWDNINRRHTGAPRLIKAALTRWSLGRAVLVVCGNLKAQEFLAAKGFRGRSCVLPQLAVEPSLYTKRGQRTHVGTPTVVFVGRLVPEKGLFVLFAALGRLLDLKWRLMLVGDGPIRPQLEHLAKAMAERIQFVGAVKQDDVPSLLGLVDLFVLPSIATPTWQEQFGYAMAQAMMSGVPVVASRSGAIPDVLGDTGVLVPENDVDALEHALREMLTDEARRVELGRATHERAMERFGPEVVASSYLTALTATDRPRPKVA